MEGTRQSLLNEIAAWVTNPSGQERVHQRNTYWIYGLPGIGKTSLAHSICADLHVRRQLAGSYFCRRDDPNLKEHKNILPTLINHLAIIFPPFRNVVATRFHNDPNLRPESMDGPLFLDFLRSVPRRPKHHLVLVIDALDECVDHRSRPVILEVLTDAAAQTPWLKVIITSRPEADIQRFFDNPICSLHLRYDLAADEGAGADLEIFARNQFDLIASEWYLSTWPEESDFNMVISRANGLFIFIRTLILYLEFSEDPKAHLKAALQGSASTGLESLYELYSNILQAQLPPRNAEFQKTIGFILTTTPYRPLCAETIAELSGAQLHLVKKWVDALSSLLYRDQEANGAIRVRHLSISDFFLSKYCHIDYRVNPEAVNMQLGISCLKTMVEQLRFNICKLQDSRFANAEIEDLSSRIKENISGALQYSALYWSNHLCLAPDNGDRCTLGRLIEFFEGLYPLFWIEVLSVMCMVPIGAPSLRRVLAWVKVSVVQLTINLDLKITLITAGCGPEPS
jgi:hypothetical protein